MVNKILLYGDVILDYIDGSSVWLVNLAKLLASDNNNQVDVLLKVSLKSDILISELKEYPNVRFILADSVKEMISNKNILTAIDEIDGKNNYSSIIVRGFQVAKVLANSRFKSKLIPYLTDFNQNSDEITEKEINELLAVYNSVDYIFVQTNEMKEYFVKILNVNGEKCCILNPIVFALPHAKKEPKTICYAGKLSKLWYIEELIEIMDILYKKNPEIKLYFVGSKFNADLNDKSEEIIDSLKSSPNIEFIPKLPNNKTRELINKCELGYCFRSEKIDNDESLELSTKFLEYGIYDVAPIVRKTKMFSKILGEDYPLYVSDVQDASNKILDYFNISNESDYNLTDKFKDYGSDKVYQNIKPVLDYYFKKNKGSKFKRILKKLMK